MFDKTFSCPPTRTVSENTDCTSTIKQDLEHKRHRKGPCTNLNMSVTQTYEGVLITQRM
jgi:hypothetical protein